MKNTEFQPIAGCAGSRDSRAAGYDRRWLLVDAQGDWIARGRHPGLGSVSVQFRFGYLAMHAPGMLRTDVPLDVIEDDDSVARQVQIGGQSVAVVDEGDLAAAWFSNFLGTPCRLVKRHPPEAAVDWPDGYPADR